MMPSVSPSVPLTLTIILAMQIGGCSTLMVPPPSKSNPLPSASNIKLHAFREATFGMGCFWEPSESLHKLDGVLDTVVGYAGGSLGGSKPLQPPTYDDVCYGDAWVESVMVAFDDEVLSYRALLDQFWELQKPRAGGERQYQSVIFPSNEMQFEEAQKWLDAATEENWKRESDDLPVSVVNIEFNSNKSKDESRGRVTPSMVTARNDGVLFYRAEEYHQNFWHKWRPRIAGAVFLVSTSVDLSIVHASVETQSQWKLGTAILLVVGSFYYGVLERMLDDSVSEILPGDFARSAAAAAVGKSKRKMKRGKH